MSNNHISESGNLHMIDVCDKEITTRVARASGTIVLNDEAFSSVVDLNNKKGDVLNTARLAGINAAKLTSSLIPLAHNISLNSIEIDFEFNKNSNEILSIAQVKSEGKTGVEVEAMVAVQISLMTIYDMCKYLDRGMEIKRIRLLSKTGGKSGTFTRDKNA